MSLFQPQIDIHSYELHAGLSGARLEGDARQAGEGGDRAEGAHGEGHQVRFIYNAYSRDGESTS